MEIERLMLALAVFSVVILSNVVPILGVMVGMMLLAYIID